MERDALLSAPQVPPELSFALVGFKAIELDPVSRQRTGREHALEAETRQAAVDELLQLLGVTRESARIDPSRTLIRLNTQLWTLVGFSPPVADESAALRRAGAKHKQVR